MKGIFTGIGAFVAIILFVWLIQGNDFFMYKFFAPKYEQVRRETFEQTKSYRQGMVQNLYHHQENYVTADSTQKLALRSIILHEYADYPEESLPPDLIAFLHQLRRVQ